MTTDKQIFPTGFEGDEERVMYTPPIDNKPTTITAQQFVRGGYAKLIAEGKCDMLWHDGDLVKSLRPMGVIPLQFEVKFKGHSAWAVIDPDRSFPIEWLPADAQASEKPPVAEATGDDVVYKGMGVITGFHFKTNSFHHLEMNLDGWPLGAEVDKPVHITILNEEPPPQFTFDALKAELATVRSQLAVSQAEAGKLVDALNEILDTTPSEPPSIPIGQFIDLAEHNRDYARYVIGCEIDTALAAYLRATDSK